MSQMTSFIPLADKDFGFPQAAHLLRRAGYGGTHAQIQALADMGPVAAVNYLVDYEKVPPAGFNPPDYDPDIIRPYTPEERREMRANRNDPLFREKQQAARNYQRELDARQMNDLEGWWLSTLISTARPLQEKLTLMWHNHFASNHRNVGDSFLMLKQNQFFRENANGSFADLALGIVQDPAMIKFLNNDANRKAHPNENLARELMELFTLGEGNYTEDDIKQGARALTGASYKDNDFHFYKNNHDPGEKIILGQRGQWNAQHFVRILLNRPQCPVFIASKLYRQFVADVDEQFAEHDKINITQISKRLWASKYELKPVLKAIFRSQMFYSDRIMGNQIKSPAQLLVGTIRTLNLPVNDVPLLLDAMTMMGQKLFNPPSVAGWYGGRSWINTSTLFIRQNLTAYLITGKLPFKDNWTPGQMTFDPTSVIKGLDETSSLRTPTAIVDHVLAVLLSVNLPDARRQQLVQFMKERSHPTSRDAMAALLLLVTAMPEYQLC